MIAFNCSTFYPQGLTARKKIAPDKRDGVRAALGKSLYKSSKPSKRESTEVSQWHKMSDNCNNVLQIIY